jgi:dihydrofolate reductase
MQPGRTFICDGGRVYSVLFRNCYHKVLHISRIQLNVSITYRRYYIEEEKKTLRRGGGGGQAIIIIIRV